LYGILPYDSGKEDLLMDRNHTQSSWVGWAKRPGANAIGGVPTNRREDISKKWWARHRCAFAHFYGLMIRDPNGGTLVDELTSWKAAVRHLG
jgi:hypothetical protein